MVHESRIEELTHDNEQLVQVHTYIYIYIVSCNVIGVEWDGMGGWQGTSLQWNDDVHVREHSLQHVIGQGGYHVIRVDGEVLAGMCIFSVPTPTTG